MKKFTKTSFDQLKKIIESNSQKPRYQLDNKNIPLSIKKRILSLSPFSHSYYSPFNPIFSFELSISKKVRSYPIVLFRDGRQDLANFFSNNPRPMMQLKNSFFFFHASLADLVPKRWMERAYVFELRYKKSKKKKKLLLVGIFNTSHFDDHYLKKLKKRMAPFTRQGGHILLCPIIRKDSENETSLTEIHPSIRNFQNFFYSFGTNIKFVDEKEIWRYSDMSDRYYHFLEKDSSFITDNYFEHHFLLRKSRPFFEKKLIKRPNFSFGLSFEHEIVASDLSVFLNL